MTACGLGCRVEGDGLDEMYELNSRSWDSAPRSAAAC